MQRQIEPGFEWIEERTAGNIFVVGRLKPGVTMAQAEANLSSVAARLAQTLHLDPAVALTAYASDEDRARFARFSEKKNHC